MAHRKTLLFFAVALIPATSVAQQPRDAHAGVVLDAGFVGVPDALGSQCGSRINGGGSVGVGGGAALLVRVRRAFVVEVDSRVTHQLSWGCGLVLPAVDTEYAAGLRRDPLTTSAVRFGVETPKRLPLFRLTAGVGAIWGNRVLPLGLAGLAWSTRGDGKRFFLGIERAQTRVRADEVRHALGTDQPDTRRSIVLYPAMTTFRVGLEFPLGFRR